jgi:AraC-like DNA-binding protein
MMTGSGIKFKVARPSAQLSDFVESFWMVKNTLDTAHNTIGLPDGRFDIIFSFSASEPFHAMLMGLGTVPEQHAIPPKIVMFAVSFKLPAIEYLPELEAAALPNHAHRLPADFWGIKKTDLRDFAHFCEKITAKLSSLIRPRTDYRKQKLFDLIYSSNGTMSVNELSEKVFWSSRQINRYFNAHFGLSLKAYCAILRFKSSLHHIKAGALFPYLNLADQALFIKAVKMFSGVTPGDLLKNKHDRFILLSSLPGK